jgi:uncharacterized protein
MILGKIIGKVSTTRFKFIVTHPLAQKFEFIQVHHKEYGFVLCQILEIIRDSQETIAQCNVIGYKDENNRLQGIRTPFIPGIEVLNAEDEFIKTIIELDTNSAYIGKLQGREIPIHLDLQKLLTKHISILAKSGAGKSYTVGVLIEEIIEKGVPLLIIDPHGEYSSLKFPTTSTDIELRQWKIDPKGYASNIQEFGDPKVKEDLIPLKLAESMNSYELMKWLPLTLSSTQEAILFSIIKDLEEITFDNIILGLEQINSQYKWSLLDMIWHLKGLELFSQAPTSLNSIIQPGKCSILNLKGMEPTIQSMIAGKLLYDLFLARKRGKIPPFFCIIEEAHNFVPEKGFGTAKSSEVIRLISSEGRKFGVGLCIVSQRPALVQKTVLAQCTSQIIMKMTNPNDLRMVGNSVEGITAESLEEIQHLSIGSALVCGIVDRPLIVNIRARKTKHGGNAVQMISSNTNSENAKPPNYIGTKGEEKETHQDNINIQTQPFIEKIKEKVLLAIIKPSLSIKDIKLISQHEPKKITTYLIPALFIECMINENSCNILIDRMKGRIVVDPQKDTTYPLEEISPNLAFLKSVEYENISYDIMLPENISVQKLMEKVKQFVTITNHISCHIAYHKTEF